MAQSCNVLEHGAQHAWGDPACVIHYIESELVAVARIPRLYIETVEADNAALGGIVVEVQKGIGEEESRNVLGGDIARHLGRAHYRRIVRRGSRRKQFICERVCID